MCVEQNYVSSESKFSETDRGRVNQQDLISLGLQGRFEPPLGVIREQGEWPLRHNGARSMA